MAHTKQTSKSSTKSGVAKSFTSSKTRFSKPSLAVVVLVFVVAGGFFLWRSLAATTTIFYAEDLAKGKSVNYVTKTETKQNKKNARVIQITNTSTATAKAIYIKNVASGNYKACLVGVSRSNNPAGTFIATDTTVRGFSYYYATSTEYKPLACMQIYHDNSQTLTFEVTNKRTDSSLRISSIVLEPNNGTTTTPNISISPILSSVSSVTNFTFGIWVDSLTTPVNAVQANLAYDATKFDFVNIDVSKSTFTIAAQASGGNGRINIARGNIAPLSGKQLVGYVTLKPKVNSGTTTIIFTDGTQLASATTNADILKQKTGGGYSFSPL